MKTFKNFIFIILSASAVFVSGVYAADNLGIRNVYSVFSENFNGVKMDGYSWSPGSVDNTQMFTWRGGNNSISVASLKYGSPLGSKDGSWFWRVTSSGMSGWSGMAVTFTSSQNVAVYRNMSYYAGGTIEFWARSSRSASLMYKVGVTDSNSGNNNGNRVATLGSLGFRADNTWQRIVINLNSLGANLNQIKNVFLMLTDNINADIDIDCIVWQKTPGTGSFTAALKNIGSDTVASGISWDSGSVGKRWQAAEQYIELDLDVYPRNSSVPDDNSWGIQIYTTNTDASAVPKYTGIMTSGMGSGLVASSDTSKMLPVCWRITDKVLPYSGSNAPGGNDFDKTLKIGFNSGGLFDQGAFEAGDIGAASFYCWFVMKDEAMFGLGDPDVQNLADYLRVWDRRGFHAASGDINYFGMSAGSMYEHMIKPRIYFGADFGLAVTPMEYKTNSIVIELFYE